MTMFQSYAIRFGRWPKRIAEIPDREPRMTTRPRVRLDQIDERILADIGMSKLGFPVTRR